MQREATTNLFLTMNDLSCLWTEQWTLKTAFGSALQRVFNGVYMLQMM